MIRMSKICKIEGCTNTTKSKGRGDNGLPKYGNLCQKHKGKFKFPVSIVQPFTPAEFRSIVEELTKLHEIKNHDYAGGNYLSNYTASEQMGIPGWVNASLRLQDKMARLQNFIKQKELKVKDESIEDTFKDIAVIGILALILYRNKK